MWVNTQRQNYKNHKNGKLSAERIARLEAIGFKWKNNNLDSRWRKKFAIFEQYHREGVDINGKLIGYWASRQRIDYKADKLSAERISSLEAIGFKWITQREWDETFAILMRVHREGKDVNVKDDVVIDGVRIGRWASKQRQDYKAGKLSAERVASLDAIGFKWVAKWDETFAILVRLHREGKNVNVVNSAVIDGVRIGRWVERQRRDCKAGELSAERVASLEAIGFRWSRGGK